MALYGLEGRYATALYSAAAKKQTLDTVESELKKVAGVIQKDKSVLDFLQNPILSRQAKKQGVTQMLGDRYSEVTRNFFNVLAENGRLSETPKIIDSFSALMAAHRGELTVTVTSAKPLDSRLTTQLKNVLTKSSLVKSSNSVKITSKVNPAILGGLVVEVGDKTIDLSIASRLAKLNKLITDAV